MVRRPMVPVALAFAAGVVFEAFAPVDAAVLATAATGTVAAAAVLLWRFGARRTVFVAVMAATAVCAAAMYAARLPALPVVERLAATSGPPLPARVRGVIAGEPLIRRYPPAANRSELVVTTTFALQLNALRSTGRWLPVRGELRVSLREAAPRLRYGDEIDLTGNLAAFRRPGNPGQFDALRHYSRQGYAARAYAPSAGNAVPTGGRGGWPGVRQLYDAKRAMRTYLDRQCDDAPAATLRCLLLGDRAALSDQQTEAFQRTGTIHFLAVSGLHVGMLAGSVWVLLMLAGLSTRPTAAVVIAVTIAYAVLGGLRPSIVRAAVMCTTICAGYLVYRRPDFLNTLALSAVVVMLMNPADVLSAGFQLSFLAVAAIAVFAPRLHVRLFGNPSLEERLTAREERGFVGYYLRRYLQSGIAISLAAWVITLPLGAWYFHLVTPLTPAMNLVMAPLVWGALLAGFPAAVLGPLAGGLVQPFVLVAEFCARLLNDLAALLARVPGGHAYVRSPQPVLLLACYAAAAVLASRWRPRLRAAHALGLVLVVGNLFAWGQWWSPPQLPSVTAIDVGHGCAAVARVSGGGVMLYDCGSATWSDVGADIVAPYLWDEGIGRIDVLVLSHADADHINGVAAVLDRFAVGEVIVTTEMERSPAGADLLRQFHARHLRVRTVAAGDSFLLGRARINVLHPPRPPSPFDVCSANDASMVLRVDDPTGRLLLCGDADERAIAALRRRPGELGCDVLLAPHHGRYGAATGLLLEAARPRLVLISAGAAPRDPAYHRWPVLTTHENGAVTAGFDASVLSSRATPAADD